MKTRNKITFYLNGHKHEVEPRHSHMMLADYLRQIQGLTGTKIVCAEGDCGACTLLSYDSQVSKSATQFLPINSCIARLHQVDSKSLITIEALAEQGKPSAVQKALYDCHSSQCGYCTPGFVMSLSALVDKRTQENEKALISPQEAKNALTGNLCRCTGYDALLNAACSVDLSKEKHLKARFVSKEQETLLKRLQNSELLIQEQDFKCYLPKTLKNALSYYAKEKNVKIVSGSSDLSVQHNKGFSSHSSLLSLQKISELREVRFEKGNRVKVGALVTLSELRDALKNKENTFSGFLNIFASPQIKNVATLVGNIVNASPIADTAPFLLVSNAKLLVQSLSKKREISLSDFYKGYKKTDLKKGEIVTHLVFELPSANDKIALEKVSERKDLDISCVNAAFFISTDVMKKTTAFRIALGGVAATPIRVFEVEKELEKKTLSYELIKKAQKILVDKINPLSDLRGSAEYRKLMAGVLLKRFLEERLQENALETKHL